MSKVEYIEVQLTDRPPNWWQSLVELIPELADLEGTPQPPEFHAEGNVAIHTRMAIEACPSDCEHDLLWVALLHDIGKPESTVVNNDGRITSHGHDKLGAKLAEKLLTRIGMTPERRDRIVWAIKNHMFHHAWQLKKPEDLTSRQKSYITNPSFPLLLEFLRIDAQASLGKKDKLEAYRFYSEIFQGIMRDCQIDMRIKP